MNIAFFTFKECCPEIGGIERTTSLVADNLKKFYNYGIYHIYVEDVDSYKSSFEFDGRIQIGFSRKYKLVLADFIKKNNISIIINQGYFDFGSFLNKVVGRFNLDCKQIFALHFEPAKIENLMIEPSETFRMWKNNKSFKQFLKLACFPIFYPLKKYHFKCQYREAEKYSRFIVLLSNSYKDIWTEYSGSNLKNDDTIFKIIPNSLPFNKFASVQEIQSKDKRILIVSRLSERAKQISKLLDIWKKLSLEPALKDWHFDIVGDGPDMEKYRAKINSENIQRVTMHGHSDPTRFYLQSSIFVMASKVEGLPMTLLEASEFGLVPIAYDTYPALSDVVQDGINGFCIPPYDSNAYINKIMYLVKNDQVRIKMAVNAVDNSKRFSQKPIAEKWHILIQQASNANIYNTRK